MHKTYELKLKILLQNADIFIVLKPIHEIEIASKLRPKIT